jgi:hypothetical protein
VNKEKLGQALALAYCTENNSHKDVDATLIRDMVEELTKVLPHATTKILIACPTFGIDPNPGRWLLSMLTVVQDLRRMDIDYGFIFPYRNTIHKAENKIIKHALTGKYTHILRMDDDIWGIKSGDIGKLLEADKDFISAVMFVRGFPYSRCAFRRKDSSMTLLECEKKGRDALEEVDGDGPVPVDLTAFPFTLWKTKIFDKMTYPWFNEKDPVSPDAQFCQKCLDLGIQPYAHMDIQINHQEVTPWNRLGLFNADARRMLMEKIIDPTDKMYPALVELFGEDGLKDLYILKGTGNEPKEFVSNSSIEG